MTLTVRLDPHTERTLNAACRKAGLTRSDFIRKQLREALVTYDSKASDCELSERWFDHQNGSHPTRSAKRLLSKLVRIKRKAG